MDIRWVSVDIGGRKRRVATLASQGQLWIHWQGLTYCLDGSGFGVRRAVSERQRIHPGLLVAPMPGKITRVNATVGQAVCKGDPLVVMEAMKMEYTLTADGDGVVSTVRAVPGQQVLLSEVLVRVEVKSEGES